MRFENYCGGHDFQWIRLPVLHAKLLYGFRRLTQESYWLHLWVYLLVWKRALTLFKPSLKKESHKGLKWGSVNDDRTFIFRWTLRLTSNIFSHTFLFTSYSELYQHHSNCSTGRVLFSTAQRLCQMLEENIPMVLPEKVNLPAVIHRLACQAITVCHSGTETLSPFIFS